MSDSDSYAEGSKNFTFNIPSLNLSDIHSDSITNSSTPISSPKMSNPSVESLISAARNYGDVIPRYDGNPETLESFLIKADKLYNRYGVTTDTTLNEYTFCLISSKLTNQAETFAATRSDLDTWPELKQALRTKFGDHTDRMTVSHKFKNLSINPKESLSDFIEKIKRVQTQLNTKVQADAELSVEQKKIHIEINEQTALEILYNNCPPMLQTILEVSKHKSLTEATPTVLKYVGKHLKNQRAAIPPESAVRSVPISNSNSNNMTFPRQPIRQNSPYQNQFLPNYYYNPSYNRQQFFPNNSNNQPRQDSRRLNINVPNNNKNGAQVQVQNRPTSSSRPLRPPSSRINFQRPQFQQWRNPQIHFNELYPDQDPNIGYYPYENYNNDPAVIDLETDDYNNIQSSQGEYSSQFDENTPEPDNLGEELVNFHMDASERN